MPKMIAGGKFVVVGCPHYREGILYPIGAVVEIPEGIPESSLYLVKLEDGATPPDPATPTNVGVVEPPKRAADIEPKRK